MLKTKLLHPEILAALSRAGHGARVLIADGNYSCITNSPPSAHRVFLNLMPGMVKVTDVLDALAQTIPIESALVMMAPEGMPQPIHDEFLKMLPHGFELIKKTRTEFCTEARGGDIALVIATGDSRRFANLLLTIGAIKEFED